MLGQGWLGSSEDVPMMLQLHQLSPASRGQQQLCVESQGTLSTTNTLQPFQFSRFPVGEVSTKTPKKIKAPMDVPSVARAAVFSTSSSSLLEMSSICRVQTSMRAEIPSCAVCVRTSSIFTARCCLLQPGLKAGDCRHYPPLCFQLPSLFIRIILGLALGQQVFCSPLLFCTILDPFPRSSCRCHCFQCQARMSTLSRGHFPAPCPHRGPTNVSSGLCFPLFAECFVRLDVVIMLQPSDCSEFQGEGANFNICLNSSFQTYTNWNNASLRICLLMQFANCGFRSALFSKYQLFVDNAQSCIAGD